MKEREYWEKSWKYWVGLLALVILAISGSVNPARGQEVDPHSWIPKYKNGDPRPISCCHPVDVAEIPQSVAAAAMVGTVIVAMFLDGMEPVAVNKIYQTEDPKGRAFVTKYGCLFRNNGM